MRRPLDNSSLCKKPIRGRCFVWLAWFAGLSAPVFAQELLKEPEGDVSLAQVLSAVVVRSPELATFSFELRAVEARRIHSGQWTNPELSFDVEDALGTGPYRGLGLSQTTLQLSQVIELGGKRQARTQLAKSSEALFNKEFDVLKVTVLAEATTKFAHLVADQHRLALAREALGIAEAGLRAAQRRVASGAASVVEERRARILVARSKIAAEHAEHDLLSSRRRLAGLWGATEPKFLQARGDLFAWGPLPTFEVLAGRVETNPELARLVTERAVRDSEVRLAKSKAALDLRVSAGVRRLEGVSTGATVTADKGAFAFLAGVSVPLPVFNRNQGEIGAAQARRSMLDKEESAARVEALTLLFAEYQELVHVVTVLEMLNGEMIPQAEAMMKTIDDGFKLGRFSQLELVDAQRTLSDVRKERVDAAEAYHELLARLERLLGAPVGTPDAPSRPPPGTDQDK